MGDIGIRYHIDPVSVRLATEGAITTAGAKRKSKKSVSSRLRYELDHGDIDSSGRFHMPMRLLVDGRDIWSCGGEEHLPVEDEGIEEREAALPQGHEPRHPWRWVPLIHWAKVGFHVVEQLPRQQTAWVQDDGGGMRFAFEGGLATIEWYPGLNPHWWYPDACAPMRRRPCASALTASGSDEYLRDVWTRFSVDVRTELQMRIPELADHRVYKDWFRHPAYG